MQGRQIMGFVLAMGLMLVLVAGMSAAQGPEPEGAAAPQAAVGTAFTFQARLTDGATPASGAYDLRFKLYDAANDGTQVGSTVTKTDVAVTDGLFTVMLDFGSGAFTGQARYLEVAVRPGGSTGAYVALSPRQPLTPSPYSLYSLNAGLLDNLGADAFVRTSGDTVDGDLHVNGHVVVGPSLGVGIAMPQQSLHVNGGARFDVASGRVEVSTPGAWPGIIAHSPDNSRRDIVFRDSDMSLLTSPDDQPPANDNGIIIRENGNVGIGTWSPQARLDVAGGIRLSPPPSASGVHSWELGSLDEGIDQWFYIKDTNDPDNPYRLIINQLSGNVTVRQWLGVGEAQPQQPLHVNGRGRFDVGSGRVEVSTPGGWPGIIARSSDESRRDIVFRDEGIVLLTSPDDQPPGNDNGIMIRESGNVGIGVWSPQTRLDVNGTTRTTVLQITGGSDLAEPFDVAGAGSVEPGMVVAIDPDHAGQLRLAERAYDYMVAGCVSGANGINPGLLMQQEGTVAEGAFPVALTGRVYCLADAAHGPIQPGDLLTTSDTLGHAMVVTDHALGRGAILGKAMSSLDSGRGLVLVLVALQ